MVLWSQLGTQRPQTSMSSRQTASGFRGTSGAEKAGKAGAHLGGADGSPHHVGGRVSIDVPHCEVAAAQSGPWAGGRGVQAAAAVGALAGRAGHRWERGCRDGAAQGAGRRPPAHRRRQVGCREGLGIQTVPSGRPRPAGSFHSLWLEGRAIHSGRSHRLSSRPQGGLIRS